MSFPISVSINGGGWTILVQPIGWTPTETWEYLWGLTNAEYFTKNPGPQAEPRSACRTGPSPCMLRRAIVFFDTTGISEDLVWKAWIGSGAAFGGGSLYILNGNGADPDFDASFYSWVTGRFSSPYLITSRLISELNTNAYNYFTIPSSHINSTGYTVLLLVHSTDYAGVPIIGGDHAAWPAYTASTLIQSPAGYIWVEATKLAYIDEAYAKRTQEGILDGATGKVAGHPWAEGDNLRYIDSSGNERYIAGTLEGATGKVAGHIWIEGTKVRYIDSSGNERYFEGTA